MIFARRSKNKKTYILSPTPPLLLYTHLVGVNNDLSVHQTETGGIYPDCELEDNNLARPLVDGSKQPGDIDDDW